MNTTSTYRSLVCDKMKRDPNSGTRATSGGSSTGGSTSGGSNSNDSTFDASKTGTVDKPADTKVDANGVPEKGCAATEKEDSNTATIVCNWD